MEHPTWDSLITFLNGSVRELGNELIISTIAQLLCDIIASKDRLLTFLNDSKQQLQELEVKIVNVEVQKKLRFGH